MIAGVLGRTAEVGCAAAEPFGYSSIMTSTAPVRPEVDLRAVAFLHDADLRDLLSRLARRLFDDDARERDVIQDTYLVAMNLLLAGYAVDPGTERGWMCRLLQNRALTEWKKLKRERRTVDLSDIPDIPDEDQRELAEQQAEIEKKFDAMRAVMTHFPEAPELLLAGDARKGEGTAKDPATRKKKQRLRVELQGAIGALLGGLGILMWMRTHPPVLPQPRPAWDDKTLAAASREIAVKECAARRWPECLRQLDLVKRLDPQAFGAAEQSAQAGAIAGLRGDALHACEKQEWRECLAGLDEAATYDSAGDEDPVVQLARSKASLHVRGRPRPPEQLPDAKGPFLPRAPR